MSLDQVLKDMEKGTGPERDPEKYYVSVFGEPSEQGTWGYRFEGHHISLNFTVVNGRIASSPSFFGDNPAEVREGPRAGLRALMREEDLGRALIHSLDESQRAIAIVDKTAPKDIITFDSRKAALNGQPNGLPFSKMNAKQKEALTALVGEYAGNFPPQIAEFRIGSIPQESGLPPLRLGRRNRKGPAALLSRADPRLPHRVRRHPEQRQPHPQCMARFQWRFRCRLAGPALPGEPPEAVRWGAVGQALSPAHQFCLTYNLCALSIVKKSPAG
jgi:hypothetical protein